MMLMLRTTVLNIIIIIVHRTLKFQVNLNSTSLFLSLSFHHHTTISTGRHHWGPSTDYSSLVFIRISISKQFLNRIMFVCS